VGLVIDLAAMPLSLATAARTTDDADHLARATAGDDYELLFTAPPGADIAGRAGKTRVTRIGTVEAGAGLRLAGHQSLPERLGWEH
jgi:thiamine-monophosphate kinase